MPRQPLLPIVRANPGGRFDIGTHALRQRPELELLVANCLMAWPPTEAEMAILLAHLLGVHQSEAVLTVFHSLRRSSAQRDAISEAARITLAPDERELLSALLNVHKSIEAERNALTHGHFGVYTNLPDGLVWMETKTYVDFKARMQLSNQRFTNEAKNALYSKMYVYKNQDLKNVLKDIQLLAELWLKFTWCLRAPFRKRAELYQRPEGMTRL